MEIMQFKTPYSLKPLCQFEPNLTEIVLEWLPVYG